MKMEFNLQKCRIMHVGNKNKKYKYEMNGVKIGKVEKEKDVCVTIINNFKQVGTM